MSQQIQVRRGTNTQRQAVTFAAGEPVFTTDTNQLYIGDGVTTGGNSVLGLNTTGKTNTGLLNEVWIHIRTDGQAGTGTINDPYDGSSQTKFDALMGNSGSLRFSPCRVHLGPGTFLTQGVNVYYGSQVFGCGVNITILQLAANTVTSGSNNTIAMWGLTGVPASGFIEPSIIDGLTIDGNILNQGGTNTAVTQAAQASIMRNLVVMNFSGNGSRGVEAFWVNGMSYGNPTTPHYNVLIENCVCIGNTNSAGYETYFDISGGNSNNDSHENTSATNCIIRNCKVVPAVFGTHIYGHAFTFANCNSAIVENCYTESLDIAVYEDTWSNHRIIIRNNTFTRCQAFGIYFNGSNTQTNNLIIENNDIDCIPATSGSTQYGIYGICFYYNNANRVIITRNRISLTPGLSQLPGGASNTNVGINIDGPTTREIVIKDNIIDLPNIGYRVLWNVGGSSSALSTSDAQFENNYDSQGLAIIGKSRTAYTYIAPSAGWYALWSRPWLNANDGVNEIYNDMIGKVSITTKGLAGYGTATLVGGTVTVTGLTSVIKASNVKLWLQTASGTVGTCISVTVNTGAGFTLTSTSSTDNSTYIYQIDNGIENQAVAYVSVPSSSSLSSSLTSLGFSNSSLYSTTPSCSQIKTYSSNSISRVYGYFTGPALYKVDIDGPGYVFPATSFAPNTPNFTESETSDGGSSGNTITYMTFGANSSSTSFIASTGLNIFTGSTTGQTITLPVPNQQPNPLLIKNRSSVIVTVTSATGSQIITSNNNSASASFVLLPGQNATLWGDGTYWNQESNGNQTVINSVVSANFTALGGINYQVNTSGGAVTCQTVVSPIAGESFLIADAKSSWATNNLIIAYNGTDKLNGGTSNYTASTNGGKLTVVYIDSSWGWSIK